MQKEKFILITLFSCFIGTLNAVDPLPKGITFPPEQSPNPVVNVEFIDTGEAAAALIELANSLATEEGEVAITFPGEMPIVMDIDQAVENLRDEADRLSNEEGTIKMPAYNDGSPQMPMITPQVSENSNTKSATSAAIYFLSIDMIMMLSCAYLINA